MRICTIVRHTFLDFGAVGNDAGSEKRAVSAPPAYHAASAHAEAALHRLTVAHVRAFLVSWADVARANNLLRAIFAVLDNHRQQEQDQRRDRQLRRLAQQRRRKPAARGSMPRNLAQQRRREPEARGAMPRRVDLIRFVTAAQKAVERGRFRIFAFKDEGVLLLRLEGAEIPNIAWELPGTEDRLIDIVAAAAETLRARQHDATAETLFVIAETAADIIIKEDRGQLTI